MTNGDIAIVMSIVTTACSVIAMQCKKMLYVRSLMLLINVLLVLQYAITDNISAAGVCITAIVQVIVSMLFQWKKKRFPISLMLVFMAAYITVTVISYEKAPDVLAALAACIFALAVVQTKNEHYRIASTLNCTTWLIFDLWSSTYSAAIFHSTLFVIDIVTIIRKDGSMWCEKIKALREKRK